MQKLLSCAHVRMEQKSIQYGGQIVELGAKCKKIQIGAVFDFL